ncbi:MAG: rfbC [Acidobacteria bacterium]|nr:rfbC [Acidobacteriota bacterium]
MQVTSTAIPDVLIVEPDVHADGRGFFLETYHADRYRQHGIAGPFVQDNHSRSVAGTLRGLHLQLQRPQGKLIRVIEGEILDVAVDVRRGSPTFGRWVGVSLDAESFKQVYVPPGFAHGFCVVSPIAQVEYKCTDLYDPSGEIGIAWDDPALAIAWPVADPVLSPRDQRHPPLAAVLDQLPAY